MAKKIITEPKVETDITLPPPLDKPMETFNLNFSGTLTDDEIKQMIHELIERQNALLEVVRKMVTR